MFNIKVSPTTETNLRSLFIFAAILTGIGALGSFVAGMAGIYASIGFSFLFSVAIMWYSREIALWAFGAKEVKRGEKPEGFDLNAMVDKLRQEKSIDLKVMPKVCIIESDTKNAFATGRHKGHTAIAITTGLLKEAKKHAKDMEEAILWIEAIFCHELGHIVNRDILSTTTMTILVSTIQIISESLYEQRRSGNQSSQEQNSFLQSVAKFLLLYWIIPFSATLLSLSFSRTREFAADDMAAKCGRAKDLAKAFELLRNNKADSGKKPNPTMNALSRMMCASLDHAHDHAVTEKLKNPKIGWCEWAYVNYQKLSSTHPPLEERIERMNHQYEESQRESAKLR